MKKINFNNIPATKEGYEAEAKRLTETIKKLQRRTDKISRTLVIVGLILMVASVITKCFFTFDQPRYNEMTTMTLFLGILFSLLSFAPLFGITDKIEEYNESFRNSPCNCYWSEIQQAESCRKVAETYRQTNEESLLYFEKLAKYHEAEAKNILKEQFKQK